MKKLNRAANSTAEGRPPSELPLADLERALRDGATVIDTRSADRFAEAHIPGTFNIPDNRSFLNWSGALIPDDGDLYFIVDTGGDEGPGHLFSELLKIGINGARGYFTPKVLEEWQATHDSLEQMHQMDATSLSRLGPNSEVTVVDVRGLDEWKHGHLPGAVHIPLASLPNRIEELTHCSQVVLHCRGGGRSAIAASFIKARGFANVSNLVGGFDNWAERGFEVVADSPVSRKTAARKS